MRSSVLAAAILITSVLGGCSGGGASTPDCGELDLEAIALTLDSGPLVQSNTNDGSTLCAGDTGSFLLSDMGSNDAARESVEQAPGQPLGTLGPEVNNREELGALVAQAGTVKVEIVRRGADTASLANAFRLIADDL